MQETYKQVIVQVLYLTHVLDGQLRLDLRTGALQPRKKSWLSRDSNPQPSNPCSHVLAVFPPFRQSWPPSVMPNFGTQLVITDLRGTGH